MSKHVNYIFSATAIEQIKYNQIFTIIWQTFWNLIKMLNHERDQVIFHIIKFPSKGRLS